MEASDNPSGPKRTGTGCFCGGTSMKKRLLSILLTVALLTSLLALDAGAVMISRALALAD